MLKIEFPADNKALASAIGRALVTYGANLIGGAIAHDDIESATPADTVADETAERHAAMDAYLERNPKPATDAVIDDANEGDIRVDLHGVPFDPAFCSAAKDPFYSSGKGAGQWKKRKGVGEPEYDVWYANLKSATAPRFPADTPEVNTAAAFGMAPAAAADPAPTTPGALVVWASARQADGSLTAQQITDAYVTAGVALQELFIEDDQQPHRVAAVYNVLAAQAAA